MVARGIWDAGARFESDIFYFESTEKSGNFRTIEEAAKARALAEERYFASVIDKFQKDKAEN